MPDITGTLKPPRLAAPPDSPVVGQMYFDTDITALRFWDGSNWQGAGGVPNLLPAVILAPTTSTRNVIQPTADVVPVIIKGNPSQSVALQEWQDGNGNMVSKINADGGGEFAWINASGPSSFYADVYVGNIQLKPSNDSIFCHGIDVSAINDLVMIKVRGFGDQTVDLQQWQDGSSTVLAKVTADGTIDATGFTIGGVPIGGGGAADLSTTVILAPATSTRNVIQPTAAVVPMTIKSYAAATANLMEFYDNAGVLRGAINYSGSFLATFGFGSIDGAVSFSFASNYINIFNPAATAIGLRLVTSGAGIDLRNLAGQRSLLTYANSGMLRVAPGVSNTLSPGLQIVSGATGAPADANIPSGETCVWYDGTDGAARLMVKGKSANGTIVTGILPLNGVSADLTAALILAPATAARNVIQPTADVIPVTVKAIAGQTANLQEWQDSTGVVLHAIKPDGLLLGKSLDFGTLSGPAPGATVVSVKQVADTGPRLLILNDGTYYLGPGTGAVDCTLSRLSAGVFNMSNSIFLNTAVASTTPLFVRGAVSQSVDLTVWQDSGGASLLTIDKNGTIIHKRNAAPADADIDANEMAFWFDPTNSASKFMLKAKQANGTVVSAALPLSTSGVSSLPGVGFFGNGSDGAITLQRSSAAPSWATKTGSGATTTFTLTRDVYATTLDFDDSAGSYIVVPAGYRIFANVSMIIDPTVVINADGAAAVADVAGTGAAGNIWGPGGAGSTGATNTTATQATAVAGSVITKSASAVASGGAGGGTTAGTGNGVAGGAISHFPGDGGPENIAQAIGAMRLGATSRPQAAGGGTGGNSTGGTTAKGGGGGGGAGIVSLYAMLLVNNGTVRAKGGAGGNGALGNGTAAGGGGGGGGGGIIIVYGPGSTLGTLDVSGGGGGTPAGTGGTGGTGVTGATFLLPL